MIISNSKYPGITYDMFTGEFYRVRLSGQKQTAVKTGIWGSDNGKGYLKGQANNKSCKLHRLAFEFVGVIIPEGISVDHINGIKDDNRWINLRLVTNRENIHNRKKTRKGLHITGSTFDKRREKYASQIIHNKKHFFLGYFDTEMQAHAAYMNYLDEHNIPYLPEIDHREGKNHVE